MWAHVDHIWDTWYPHVFASPHVCPTCEIFWSHVSIRVKLKRHTWDTCEHMWATCGPHVGHMWIKCDFSVGLSSYVYNICSFRQHIMLQRNRKFTKKVSPTQHKLSWMVGAVPKLLQRKRWIELPHWFYRQEWNTLCTRSSQKRSHNYFAQIRPDRSRCHNKASFYIGLHIDSGHVHEANSDNFCLEEFFSWRKGLAITASLVHVCGLTASIGSTM